MKNGFSIINKNKIWEQKSMEKKINVYHLRTVDTKKEIGERGCVKVGGRPYATVAIEINEDGTVNRGVSICSAKDGFIKKVGTQKAVGRLMSAKKAQSNILPMLSFESTQRRLLKKLGKLEPRFKNTCFEYLGGFHVMPTKDEIEMFKSDFNVDNK